MIAPDRPRRSALFMPAINAKALAKARTLPADAIIIDLEDSVAPERKAEARAAALAAVAEGGFGGREVVIRANGLDTPWGADDLAAIARSRADAVLLPKVSRPEDVRAADIALSAAPAALQLWTMIESCGAMLRLDQIAALAPTTRLSLWVIGTNDLAKDMRAQPGADRLPLQPLLAVAVCAARAHGLAILDSVCNEFRDLDLFRAEAQQGRRFGFDGKTLIHPAQVEPCNAAYSPAPADLAWAEAVIAAFGLPENKAKGAIQVEGKMAELLHLEDAERLVAMAKRIAQLEAAAG
ncbi:CoA ester lyase [Novosphingobium flavum]|uniref:CoA ester lyase n=1 Tax=Novosphingobium flavum TaxID=1778672 RepID=A0A7X1KMR2_9SPHN|nr:CoA ester lyase [Novosphingobium flavum]MBC2666628.1 CoA ester lyase [Novosphingobium flavum]